MRSKNPVCRRFVTPCLDHEDAVAIISCIDPELRACRTTPTVTTFAIDGATKAIDLAETSLKISQESGNKSREALSYVILASINNDHGDWRAAIKYGAKAIDIARSIGDVFTAGLGMSFKGYGTFMSGERQEGIELMQAGCQTVEATGSHMVLSLVYACLAEIHALADDPAMACSFADKSLQLGHHGEKEGEVIAYRALALAAAKQSPPAWDEVDAHMRQSIRLAEETGARPGLGVSNFRYSDLLREKGDLARASEHLRNAAGLFREMGMAWWLEQAEQRGE